MREFRPTRRGIVALVLALAGFVVHVGESSTTIVNGKVTSSHDYNYAAFVLGLIAIGLAGYVARAILANGEKEAAGPPAMHFAFLGLVAVLGAYQVLHGLDIV